ncbi:MAG TPA: nickel pincer cofactor biosynthesis protein LarC [Kiritimatiellia bacterium]|nr:nickel pincer cofactor biosynthesis protein LarC [Kiritimatiellia bacterium]
MRHLHVDSLGGASGDMILGALLAVGADEGALRRGLASLCLEPFDIHVDSEAESNNLRGVRVHVHADEGQGGVGVGDHEHHGHTHLSHRGLREITALIEGADLPERTRDLALRVFDGLGEAEAKIHGVPKESIHFHEVGAMDSILDIVGCCLGLELLGVTGVSVGALPQGVGEIRCAHGVFPNPAPATVELLKGMEVVATDEPYELVTPTGAALLATWRTTERPPAGCRVVAAGYGLGHRKLRGRPNVLRATLYDVSEAGGADRDQCLQLECNVDDANPELLGALGQSLLAKGMLEVFWTPVYMKKGRPGVLLTVLCEPERREVALDTIFRESTTFGVREQWVERRKLARRFVEVATSYGRVPVKVGLWRGEEITRAPEMDVCIQLATEHGVPVRVVYEAAVRAALA